MSRREGRARRFMASAQVFPFSTTGFDVGSLINSRMWTGEWVATEYVGLGYSPTVTYFNDPTDGPCALVNAAGDSGTYGTVRNQFVCPPGCTSVTLKTRIKLPTGATPGAIRFGLFNPGLTDFVDSSSIAPTPSGTLTEYTITYTGLTPGLVYYPIFNFNYPAQSPCLVQGVDVVPVNGDGLFGGTFYRLACGPETMIYDGQPEVWYRAGGLSNTHLAGSNARLALLTNATSFAIEVGVSSIDFPDYAGVGVRVANALAEFLIPGATGYSLQTFTKAAGTKRVEAYVGPQWKGAFFYDGAFPRCIYVGPCTTLSRPGALASSAKKLLVIGDSVGCGYYADPGKGFWNLLTDAGTVKAVMRAVAGQSLFDTCPDAAARTAYVALMAAIDFDALYIEVGANDALTNTFTDAAGFATALADLLDKFHAAFPSKHVYLQTPFYWDAAVDSVVVPYRSAEAALVTTRAAWCTLIDGTTLVAQSYLKPGDNYHYTTAGHAVIAANLGPLVA